jgi:ubiquinol-cytochrome c reductase cytochrome c subunit
MQKFLANCRPQDLRTCKQGVSALSILAAFAILFVATNSAAQGASAPKSNENSAAGNAENGKKIYVTDGCYECHGRAGQGSRLSGPKIGPQPIPFPTFVAYIRAPQGQMPPYTSKVLSDAELADVYAFLRSLPKPPDPKSIPALN